MCECESYEEDDLCCYVLGLEKIYSVSPRRTVGRLDMRWPQVMVAPDDLERASEILSRPIAPEMRRDFEAEESLAARPFEIPMCVRCSSTEVLLESIDPFNKWRCETCDEVWAEEAPQPPVAKV